MTRTHEAGSVTGHDGRDARSIPGAREPGLLTRFGSPAVHVPFVPGGPGTMDAATIAERQREGGGAPSQRRPPRTTRWWEDLAERTLRSFLATAHAWRAHQPLDVDRHSAHAARRSS